VTGALISMSSAVLRRLLGRLCQRLRCEGARVRARAGVLCRCPSPASALPPWCESGAGRVGGFGTCFVGCACRRACACARLRACMCVHVHVFVRACGFVCDDCDAEGIHTRSHQWNCEVGFLSPSPSPCPWINLKSPCGHLNARDRPSRHAAAAVRAPAWLLQSARPAQWHCRAGHRATARHSRGATAR
jgi:hypothetical protein